MNPLKEEAIALNKPPRPLIDCPRCGARPPIARDLNGGQEFGGIRICGNRCGMWDADDLGKWQEVRNASLWSDVMEFQLTQQNNNLHEVRNARDRKRIELKSNNLPKSPGYYLVGRSRKEHRPDVVKIQKYGEELFMLSSGGVYPLRDCEKEALWSDEISIDHPAE